MMKPTQRVLGSVIGIALIAGGLAAAVFFVKTRPQAGQRPMSSMVPVVETIPLAVSSQPLVVECLGTVVADKTAAVQPEVPGRIVAVNARLVEGERVGRDEVLVEIEAADYGLALLKAEAGLQTAQSNLRIEEGQQDAVRHEHDLMGLQETNAYRNLVLREPQLKSARAAVRSAELAVENARLTLERTKIRAPFDAVVVTSDADVGDYAQPGKTLFELTATDRYFVRASIPLSALGSLPDLGRTPYRATIALSDGTVREAQTFTLLPDLTEKGRMARLLLTVAAPCDHARGRPMLLNEVVRVRIEGKMAEDVSLIPRRFFRDGNVVWMVDREDRLRILPADLLHGYADEVLVRVVADPGLELVTTDLAAAVNGMQLRRLARTAAPEQPPDSGAEKRPRASADSWPHGGQQPSGEGK